MTEIIKTCQVAASPTQVWQQLAAFDTISTWAENVDHSSLLNSLDTGVGAARRVQVGRLALIETVTVWEPVNELAYSIQGLPPLVKSITNQWRVTECASGTEVSLTTFINPGASPRGKIAAKVLGLVLGRASQQMLDGLNHAVTSPAVTSPAVASPAVTSPAKGARES